MRVLETFLLFVTRYMFRHRRPYRLAIRSSLMFVRDVTSRARARRPQFGGPVGCSTPRRSTVTG